VSKGSTPKFFLECSTIEVSTSNDVRGKIYASGLGDFVDSPVSGGIDSASKGELSIMVGGTAELYERAKPILRMMGKEQGIFLCGPPGAGLATKQINNYCNFVNYAVLCEGKWSSQIS
jgi:3-hydroxyisobutyrate dehydrogenase-like beta-hydroxyacid dehydrogenase